MNRKFVAKNWWIGLIFGFLGCVVLSEILLFNPEYFFAGLIIAVCFILMGKEGAMLMLENKVVYKKGVN